MTSTGKTRGKNKKACSLVKIENVGEPYPDTSPQVKSLPDTDGSCGNKRKSSSSVTVSIERTTPNDLPSGWIKEVRTSKSGSKMRKDQFYFDPVSGYMFRSKPDALRFVKTNDIRSCVCKPVKRDLNDIKLNEDKIPVDNMDEPVAEKSPQSISVTATAGNHKQEGNADSVSMIKNVGASYPETSPQVISLTDTNGSRGKKRKSGSFVTVSIERTTPNDLPSGWLKEVRTSKSGSKIRKDQFYTDPVSGYMFRSKPDALRFVKTNDIHSCVCKPLKRDLKDINLNEDKIPIVNMDKPVAEKSPQIISVTTADGIHEQEGNADSVSMIENVVEPYPDTSPQVISLTDADGSRGKRRKSSSFVTVSIERTTPSDLPSGWIKEVRTGKSGSKMRKDQFYTDPVSGYMFRSKPDALRFVKTNDIRSCICKPLKRDLNDINLNEDKIPIGNMDEPVAEKPPQIMPVTATAGVHKQEGNADSVSMIKNVGEPYPETSPQVISLNDTDGSRGKKRKSSSFVTVSVERTTPNDLPSGWIKEVRTSKSGSKMRNDPFYIDPVSGYMFRSKPDALRFLKTNDIHSCVAKPVKRALDDINLNENKIPIENVGEPCPDISPQVISLTDADGSSGKKRKNSSFVTVSIERTTPNDLPSGWIKEVRTSKSGSKMRIDPFYTDPVSGYMFRSKPDALRFLKTNDIRSCISKPLKRDLGDVKLNENKIPIENVGDPCPDTSPQVISLTNTPCPDTSPQVMSLTNTDGRRGKKRKSSSFVTVSIERTTPNDLPSGWIKEVRTSKSGDKMRIEPFYTDPVSGYKFRSKPDALRFLKHNDIRYCISKPLKRDLDDINLNENKTPIENVGEPCPDTSPQVISCPDTSPQVISLTDTNGSRGKKRRKSSTFVTVSIERTTPNGLPPGWIKEVKTSKSGDKMKIEPFYTDPVSGYKFRSKPDALRFLKHNDIRYCFSKPLKRDFDDIKLNENNIPSSNPANENLSMNIEQLFSGEEPNGGLESNGTKSLEEPGTTILKPKQAKKSAKMGNKKGSRKSDCILSKKGQGVEAVDVAIGSLVTDPSKQLLPESAGRNNKGSRKPKKGVGSSLPLRTSKRLARPDPEVQLDSDLKRLAGSDPEVQLDSDLNKLAGSDPEVQLDSDLNRLAGSDPEVQLDSDLKRLAGSDHEVQFDLDLNASSTSDALKGSPVAEVDAPPGFLFEASDIIPQDSIPWTSNVEPVKEAVDHAVMDAETRQDVNELKGVEKHPSGSSAIPEEPSGEKASNKPLDDGQQPQEPQLCYDFGDSWSDPLEFALKTLRGELPVDDNLTFPSCFDEQLDTTNSPQSQFVAPINSQNVFASNSDSSTNTIAVEPPSQFVAPINSQNVFASNNSESSKNTFAVEPLPASSPSLSSLSAFGNINFSSFSAFNYQPRSESSEKDNAFSAFNYQPRSESPDKHNAVNPFPPSPSLSPFGNLGFNYQPGNLGFNYQPSNDVGKKDSQTKFNP